MTCSIQTTVDRPRAAAVDLLEQSDNRVGEAALEPGETIGAMRPTLPELGAAGSSSDTPMLRRRATFSRVLHTAPGSTHRAEDRRGFPEMLWIPEIATEIPTREGRKGLYIGTTRSCGRKRGVFAYV
jgi:hypothetical protein